MNHQPLLVLGREMDGAGNAYKNEVGDSVQLLLEVEVTESLCSAMSRDPMMPEVGPEGPGGTMGPRGPGGKTPGKRDKSGLVEVTIVRPAPLATCLVPKPTRPSHQVQDTKTTEDPRENRETRSKGVGHEEQASLGRLPCIELGALKKILRNAGRESSSSRMYEEAVLRLKSLIGEWAMDESRLDDLLESSNSLTKCRHCGVISRRRVKASGSQISRRERKGPRDERSHRERTQRCSSRSQKISNESSRRRPIATSRSINEPPQVDLTKEPSLVPRSTSGTKLAPEVEDVEAHQGREETKEENSTMNALKQHASSRNTLNAHGIPCPQNPQNPQNPPNPQNLSKRETENTDGIKMEVAKATSSLPRDDASKKRHSLYRRDRECESSGIPSDLVETVKYLASGRLDPAPTERKKMDLPPPWEEIGVLKRRPDLEKPRQSFTLHGSRDDDPRGRSGFWLYEDQRVRNMTEEPRSQAPSQGRARGSGQESIRNCAKNQAILNAVGSEDPTTHPAGPLNESDTTAFSSSSAENMIREWMVPVDKNSREPAQVPEREGTVPVLAGTQTTGEIVRNIRERIAEAIDRYAGCSTISEDQLYVHEEDPDDGGKLENIKERGTSSEGKSVSESPSLPPIPPSRRGGRANRSLEVVEEAIRAVWTGKVAPTPKKTSKDSRQGERSLARQQYVVISAPTTSVESREESLKMTYRNPAPAVSSSSCGGDNASRSLPGAQFERSAEKLQRLVTYDDVSSGDASSLGENGVEARKIGTSNSPVLPIYRKILESNEDMDWETFQQLVVALHPSQKELWRDICRAVGNEARRVAGESGATTEVCIEINPIPCGSKRGKVRARGDEISFEMDMTLKDVESFLDKKLRDADGEKPESL